MTSNRIVALVAVIIGLASCGGSTAKDTGALDATNVPATIEVTSPAFTNNGAIPREQLRRTGHGADDPLGHDPPGREGGRGRGR